MNEEVKQEASIPVQTRVNIVKLASMLEYWESTGYNIKTMSQLVSWSVDLVYEILDTNKFIKNNQMGIGEARNVLEERGLFQKSLKDRAFKKLGTAISFEGMRGEGINPSQYNPRSYNKLHNKHSVQTFNGKVSNEKLAEMTKVAESYVPTNNELTEEKKNSIWEKVRNSGVNNAGGDEVDDTILVGEKMTNEQFDAKQREIERKDRERLEAEKNFVFE